MKLLILTVSAGDGHNSISRAVRDAMVDRGAEVLIYDLFKEKSRIKSFIVHDLYFGMNRYFTKPSNAIYESMKKRDPSKNTNNLIHSFTRKNVPEVQGVLDEFNPEIVLCAHLYAGSIMGTIIAHGGCSAKVINIVPDFDVLPFFENLTNLDYLITPNEDFDSLFIRKGFAKNQLVPTGIPVKMKFSAKLDKLEIRKKLGIKPDAFTVLLMNGGIGFGNTLQLIKDLRTIKADMHTISVSGRNQKLYDDISQLTKEESAAPITNLGYADNVDELMSAADCLIGKAGTVTICEAFNKNLPIILTSILPWQEYNNMLYLSARGACEYIPEPSAAREIVERYINNPSLLAAMKTKISVLRKPNATSDLCDFIFSKASRKA